MSDGSYIKEITNEICSCGYVLECIEGRGRIAGSFPEKSKEACARVLLLAIHFTLLAGNKIDPKLQGKVEIVSDCLGALSKITNLPENRIPSGCKHLDILKVIMVHHDNMLFYCEYISTSMIHVDVH